MRGVDRHEPPRRDAGGHPRKIGAVGVTRAVDDVERETLFTRPCANQATRFTGEAMWVA
jgi:hypothetical protein